MNDVATNGIHLTKKYTREEFIPTDLQWNVTEIADDFTLYDLFHLAYSADTLVPGICAAFGMPEFDAFWDQINLPRDPGDDDDVKYLELYWRGGYDTRTTKKTGKPTDQKNHGSLGGLCDSDENHWDDPKIGEMSNLMGFHGIGPYCSLEYLHNHKCDNNCKLEDTGYGIEFTSVNNLKHLPIRVSPKVSFHPSFVESNRDFHRTGFELTINPTLWCFITSIFWELTFTGNSPDVVVDKKQELLGRIDEAKDYMEKQMKDDSDVN